MAQKSYIYKNLASLNNIADSDARILFLKCSGSAEWSRRMVASRPFLMVERLFEAANSIWFSLEADDHIDAILHDEQASGDITQNAALSGSIINAGSEPEGVGADESTVIAELEAAIDLYREKFQFIFVLGSPNWSKREILAFCKERLQNTRETEIKIAAGEQMKIIEARLSQFLEK